MSRGRRAVLPPAGVEFVGETTSGDQQLTVILTLEDNSRYHFDLSGMAGPKLVRVAMGKAIAAWSATATGGRRTHAVRGVRKGMSSFLRWVEGWNHEHANGSIHQIRTIADVTPFHLNRYRSYLNENHTDHTVHHYYGDAATMLRFAPGVSKETLREAGKRKGDAPRPVHPVKRYTHTEYAQIRNGSRRIVLEARGRIAAAFSLSKQHDDPMCEDPTRAQALHEVMLYGTPRTRDGLLTLGGGKNAARKHLFFTPDEVLAAAVLLACQRGLNLSPIVTAPAPIEHEPGVLQLDLDKPRRGPGARFWPEIFVDIDNSAVDHEDNTGAEAVRLIAEATEPARHYLAAQGHPAQRLLVYWSNYGNQPRQGISSWQNRKNAVWIPAGVTLDFRRLRRSIPGQGVSKEPTDHNIDTYLYYVRSDPDALAEFREEAALGVQKMLDHASAVMTIRVAADEDTNPDADAVIVNCGDPQHHPDTGTACTTGFYSFLDCLDCGNAATVRRLLPRQLAAIQVLEELRDGMGQTWELRFAGRYYKLMALVSRHTPAEREAAASGVAQYIPMIVAALRHEVPA